MMTQQEAFQQIVIKLLVKPGRLFAGWEPHRHGPLASKIPKVAFGMRFRNLPRENRNRRTMDDRRIRASWRVSMRAGLPIPMWSISSGRWLPGDWESCHWPFLTETGVARIRNRWLAIPTSAALVYI